MVKSEYNLRRAAELIKESDSLHVTEVYIKSKEKRQALASLYKQMMNAGASLPDRPIGFNTYTYAQLNKRVSKSCPHCVKPKDMRSRIQEARSKIHQYKVVLQEWLDDDGYTELPNDVHQLRPNV